MTTEEIEKYIKVLKINPKSKYMLIVSQESGVTVHDLARLKLTKEFIDEILLVEGNPHEVILQIPLTKK